MHTKIVSTVFWVAEPQGNGSSENNAITTYDSQWLADYGCNENAEHADKIRRLPPTYFPADCTPLENPFFLDLPVDDLNNRTIFAERCQVVPWAVQLDPTGVHCKDPNYSYLKNSWVLLTDRATGQTCAGQLEDAGPYVYNDTAYVFGAGDVRPRSMRANNAGLDVSPALRDCLGFHDLNGDTDMVDWQFIPATQVPAGPWTIVVTTSGIKN